MHVDVALDIRAAPSAVAAAYRNYQAWPRTFPKTIRGVRLVRKRDGEAVVEVDHREGPVLNILTEGAAGDVTLREFKKKYDATFVNRFEPVPGGTRMLVSADISLKGRYRLLEPFLAGYVRRQIRTFVLHPLKRAVENARPPSSSLRSRSWRTTAPAAWPPRSAGGCWRKSIFSGRTCPAGRTTFRRRG